MMLTRLAVVDDERRLRIALKEALIDEGYVVTAYETAEEALVGLDSCAPDLIVLDLGLPGMDGLEFCRRVRMHSQTPILVLSVRAVHREKVAAFDLGADDYVVKPFDMEELLARVRAHLRRSQIAISPPTEIRIGDLVINLEQRMASRNGAEIKLTRTQYEILRFLVLNAGKVATHSMILGYVWGTEYEEDAASLRVHITHLRRKIEVDPARPRLILTEIGAGYRFVIPETE